MLQTSPLAATRFLGTPSGPLADEGVRGVRKPSKPLSGGEGEGRALSSGSLGVEQLP